MRRSLLAAMAFGAVLRRARGRSSVSSRRLHRWLLPPPWSGRAFMSAARVRGARRTRPCPRGQPICKPPSITPPGVSPYTFGDAAEYGEQLAWRLWRLLRIQRPVGGRRVRHRRQLHSRQFPWHYLRERAGNRRTPTTVASATIYERDDEADRFRFAASAGRLHDGVFPALRLRRRSASATRPSTAPSRRLRRPLAGWWTTDSKSKLIYGYTAGAGFDVMLTGGLFARAEYEYRRITSTFDSTVNTVRLGLGYKF